MHSVTILVGYTTAWILGYCDLRVHNPSNMDVIGVEYEDGLNRPDIVRHPDPRPTSTYTSPTPTRAKREYCRLFLFH